VSFRSVGQTKLKWIGYLIWRISTLANIKSAIKRNKQNEKRRLRNRIYRGRARTFVQRARVEINSGDQESALEAVKTAISALDRAAEKGVIHRNNAARRKSRLMKRLAELGE
jgi:small subunit ribosomal protein S20